MIYIGLCYKLMATFLLGILFLISAVSAGDVLSLDSSNFDKIIDGSVPALIKFYAVFLNY